jgi:hypothetical protein
VGDKISDSLLSPIRQTLPSPGPFVRSGKKGPGLKATSLLSLYFRSLKATAPSVSLMLKHQGTRFALY